MSSIMVRCVTVGRPFRQPCLDDFSHIGHVCLMVSVLVYIVLHLYIVEEGFVCSYDNTQQTKCPECSFAIEGWRENMLDT